MSALPLELKAVLAAGLLLSVARAFLGVPSQHTHERLARTLVGLAILMYVLAAEALADHQDGMAAAFVVAGVEALCLAAWVTRRGGEDDDGWDDGEGPEDDEPDTRPPGAGGRDLVDWDAFDRARDVWRPRDPVA